MDDNVVQFEGTTTNDIPAETVLAGATEQELDTALILGYDKDGQFYMASSSGSGSSMLWMLEVAKLHLMGENILD